MSYAHSFALFVARGLREEGPSSLRFVVLLTVEFTIPFISCKGSTIHFNNVARLIFSVIPWSVLRFCRRQCAAREELRKIQICSSRTVAFGAGSVAENDATKKAEDEDYIPVNARMQIAIALGRYFV
ncbi:hypothetical protein E4U19_003210 [Claviceps sp. Clav32 group G5]|nr:hypothetical protein E4U19_003210 [Claviceps sp. Clav32 group G5]